MKSKIFIFYGRFTIRLRALFNKPNKPFNAEKYVFSFLKNSSSIKIFSAIIRKPKR